MPFEVLRGAEIGEAREGEDNRGRDSAKGVRRSARDSGGAEQAPDVTAMDVGARRRRGASVVMTYP